MKKKICTVFAAMLVFILCLYPLTSLADYVKTQYSDGSLWVREGPGTGYAAVTYVKNGQSVTVLSKGSTWSKIRVNSNYKVGYIKTKYIKASSDSSTPSGSSKVTDGTYKLARISTKYASSHVNLRKGPGTNFGTAGSYKRGTKVKINGQSGNWYLVEIISSGKVGYIHKNYLAAGVSGKTTGNVYFRKGPGTWYDYHKLVSSGTAVTLKSVDSGWAKVQIGSKTGYISIKYLSY